MKVLSIGSDRKLFEEKSDVHRRIIEYGTLVEALHVVVFAPKSLDLEVKNISSNVWVYPTNSRSKLFYIFDAVKIGKKILATSYKLPQVSEQSSLRGRQATSWLVTAQDPFESGLVGWFIARKMKTRLQLQVHTDFLSPHFIKYPVFNKVRAWIARFLLPRTDCVRVVSKRIFDSLADLRMKNYKSRTTILPIWVNIEKIRKTLPTDDLHRKYSQFDFIILMASRLTKEKNIALALNVFAGAAQKYPKTGLIIVGDGQEFKYLQQMTANLKLQKNVIFEKRKDDLISYFKTADLFLLTSHYEGYGRTLVEAAAADCPIITANVGLVGDILKNRKDVLVCAPGDEECFKKSIIEIIGNTILRGIFSLQAQASIERRKINKEEYLQKYKKMWQGCLVK